MEEATTPNTCRLLPPGCPVLTCPNGAEGVESELAICEMASTLTSSPTSELVYVATVTERGVNGKDQNCACGRSRVRSKGWWNLRTRHGPFLQHFPSCGRRVAG